MPPIFAVIPGYNGKKKVMIVTPGWQDVRKKKNRTAWIGQDVRFYGIGSFAYSSSFSDFAIMATASRTCFSSITNGGANLIM